MPDINDISPPMYTDPVAAKAMESNKAEARTPNWLETESAAVKTGWISSNIGRWWDRQGFDYDVDESFKMTPDLLRTLSDGLPNDRIQTFREAHSMDHALQIRKDELERVEAMNILHDSGTTGTITAIGVGLSDPITLAATIFSGGLFGAAQWGGQATRTGMAIRSGLAMSATMGGIELANAGLDPSVSSWDVAASAAGGFGFGAAGRLTANAGRASKFLAVGAGQSIGSTSVGLARSTVDPDHTAMDAIYGGMFSFVTGGVLGALHGKEDGKVAEAAMKVRKEIEVKSIQDAGATLTSKGEAYYADVHGPSVEDQLILDQVAHFDHGEPGGYDVAQPAKIVPAPTTVQERAAHFAEQGWSAEEAVAQAELEHAHSVDTVKPLTDADMAKFTVTSSQGDGVPSEVKPTEIPPPPKPAPEAKPASSTGDAAAKPSIADQLKTFADKLESDARTARHKNQIPRGPNTGAAIDPIGEVRDLAKIAMAKAIRMGVYGGEELRRIIEEFITKEAPHMLSRVGDIHRMARNALTYAQSTDGRLLPDHLADGVDAHIAKGAMKSPGMFDLSKATDAPYAYSKVLRIGKWQIPYGGRFSAASRVASEGKDPSMRLMANMLAEDVLLKKDGSMSPTPATMWAEQEITRHDFDWHDTADARLKTWTADHGKETLNPFEIKKNRSEFMTEVAKAARRPKGEYTDDPNVNALADAFRERRAQEIRMQQQYGVHGASNLEENPTYVPRNALLTAYNKAVTEHGAREVHSMWGRAFLNYDPAEDPMLTELVGAGYWSVVRKSRLGQSTEDALRTMSPQDMARNLRAVMPQATDAQINQAVYKLTTEPERAGRPNSLKQRAQLDETYHDEKTGLSVEDFLENNAEVLDRQATRSAIRRSAMAEVLRAFNKAHGLSEYGERNGALTGFTSIEGALDFIRSKQEAKVTTTNQQAIVDSDMGVMEALAKSARGQSLLTQGVWGDTNRFLRLIALLRLGGNIGFKHTANFANTISEASFPSLIRQMPTLAKIWTPFATDWRMNDQTIREAERMYAARFNPKLNETYSRAHADTGDEATNNTALAAAGRVSVSVLNKLNFLSYFSRSLAESNAVLIEQKWLDTALSGKFPSEARLKAAGIEDRAMAERITEQMRKYHTGEDGPFGRKLNHANVNEWDDQDAASAYAQSIMRTANRLANVPDIGQSPLWMTSDLGATISQFKRWPTTAYEKLFLFGVQQRDARVAAQWGLSMAFGALGYGLIQHFRTAGMKGRERDDYLKEKMAPGEVAKAAFSHSGFATFAPELTDTGAALLGFQAPFSGRAPNRWENPITGFPAAQMITDEVHGAQAGATALRTRKLTKSDVDAMMRAVPFGNSNIIRQLANYGERDLPKNRRE